MSLGERLTNLRKEHKLSQEEVAEKLNVTRQTVSKWETDGSTPDFDKIIPLCELYGITSEELLTGKKKMKETEQEKNKNNTEKTAIGIGLGVFIYIIAVAWLMISIPVFKWNPIVSTAVFLIICAIATFIIIYTSIVYKKIETKEEQESKKLYKQIDSILGTITLLIYLGVSFATHAWHITWIIWIIYAVISEVIKLIFSLKGIDYEK